MISTKLSCAHLINVPGKEVEQHIISLQNAFAYLFHGAERSNTHTQIFKVLPIGLVQHRMKNDKR